jgi:hypothetical protein
MESDAREHVAQVRVAVALGKAMKQNRLCLDERELRQHLLLRLGRSLEVVRDGTLALTLHLRQQPSSNDFMDR